MSVIVCDYCNRYIDTDFDAEHELECEIEMLKAKEDMLQAMAEDNYRSELDE